MNILDVARGKFWSHWSVADGFVSIKEPAGTKRFATISIKAVKFPFLAECIIWTFEGERHPVSLDLFRAEEIQELRKALTRWKIENTKQV